MKKIYMVAAGLVAVALAAMYIHMLRNDLSTAEDRVASLTATVHSIEARLERVQEVSREAEQKSMEAEQHKGAAKEDVRVIIKTVDCARQQLPTDAVRRMQQYRDSVHTGTSTK